MKTERHTCSPRFSHSYKCHKCRSVGLKPHRHRFISRKTTRDVFKSLRLNSPSDRHQDWSLCGTEWKPHWGLTAENTISERISLRTQTGEKGYFIEQYRRQPFIINTEYWMKTAYRYPDWDCKDPQRNSEHRGSSLLFSSRWRNLRPFLPEIRWPWWSRRPGCC